jgi:1-deoxy-D-xylulose-5-phosphate synthase
MLGVRVIAGDLVQGNRHKNADQAGKRRPEVKPLDPEMLTDAAGHRLVVTVEDGLRDGGVGAAVADALSKLAPVDGPQVRVLGVPSVYLSHGKPDAILAKLGLDADGIVDEVLSWTRSAAEQR